MRLCWGGRPLSGICVPRQEMIAFFERLPPTEVSRRLAAVPSAGSIASRRTWDGETLTASGEAYNPTHAAAEALAAA